MKIKLTIDSGDYRKEHLQIIIFVLKAELKDVLAAGNTNFLDLNTECFFRNRILLTVSISRFWDKILTGDIGNKLKPN